MDLTFLDAAELILDQNNNKPMTAREIWNEIVRQSLVTWSGKTPESGSLPQMMSRQPNRFNRSSDSPAKFSINFGGKNQDKVDKTDIGSEEGITKFTSMFPTDLKTSQSQEEEEKSKEYVKNPFRQSICVLGKSGKGKSTTIDKMLDKMKNTEFEFIIPTSSTTALLSQYSPSLNKYIPSRLGKMIMSAYKNEGTYYIAVIDECHKSNVIEMINDELLQCISTYRNDRNRFISVDDETAELYKGLSLYRGNLIVPDNFGFIFLSSKPEVIIQNSDFFNRVDIYVMIKQPPRGKEDISFEDIEYFTPVGNRENGSKSLGDIDRIKELNDAD